MPTLSGGYTASEIMKMQRDAEARVREMQRRANQQLHPAELPKVPPKKEEHSFQKSPPVKVPPADFFSSLLQDDSLLILLLILLLYKNDGDRKLILALLSLLL